MKSKMMTHRGVEFLYVDYSNFGSSYEGLEIEAREVNEYVRSRPLGSVSELIDVRNTVASIEVANLLKQNAVTAKPHLNAVAVLGVSGIRSVIAQAVTNFAGLGVTFFDDSEKAKDWLAGVG